MKPTHKMGRPRIDVSDTSVPVTVRLPTRQHADYCLRSQREGVSVPAIIRRDLDKRTQK